MKLEIRQFLLSVDFDLSSLSSSALIMILSMTLSISCSLLVYCSSMSAYSSPLYHCHSSTVLLCQLLNISQLKCNIFFAAFVVLTVPPNFFCYCGGFNLLEPELFFFNFSTPVYKMWIIQEPNKLELWNKLHFEEEKNGEYIPCLKYSVPIFVE